MTKAFVVCVCVYMCVYIYTYSVCVCVFVSGPYAVHSPAGAPEVELQRVRTQYTDCRSLSDHLLSSVPKQVEDKRLAIELTGLKQMLWEGDELSHQAFAPFGDILRWIPTHLQLADCLTKSMKPHLLHGAMAANSVTVLADAPTVVAVPATEEEGQVEREEPPAPAGLRHRSEEHTELPDEAGD